MDTWLEKGRPAIFQALSSACEKIEADFHAEFQHRKSQLRDAGTCTTDDDHPSDIVSTIDRLLKENQSLREQIATLTSALTPITNQPIARNDSGQGAAIIPSTLDSVYYAFEREDKIDRSELDLAEQRFDALLTNFKVAKLALIRRRDERDKWIQYAKVLERDMKSAELEYGISILGKNKFLALEPPPSTKGTTILERYEKESLLARFHTSKSTISDTTDDAHLQSTQGEPDEEEEGGEDVGEEDGEEDGEAESINLPTLNMGSDSQDVIIKKEASSDGPLFVSERVVRKRKVDDDLETPKRIKIEPTDSSPVTVSERHGIHTQESLDLDDIVQKMATPRKRKEVDYLSHTGRSLEGSIYATTPRLFVRPDNPKQATKISHSRVAQDSSILTPISGNKQTTGLLEQAQASPLQKSGLTKGIAVLAEDGGAYGMQDAVRKKASMETPISASKGRLDDLLNTPISANKSPIKRGEQITRPNVESPQEDLPIPGRRELPFDKPISSNKQRQSTVAKNASTPTPKLVQTKLLAIDKKAKKKSPSSALRHKPQSELRLDDFKINPLVNEGHDFAFSEVVRDKDNRASLRGCTDEHCCGQEFRALALSQRPDPPLTAAQRQEEQKLLESYLGDYSYKLANMSKDERAELWLEAKTEELANKYGKHRHRYARMQSPPGFWNADFPSTQELEAEREEAARRQKHAVAERYREAMRPGGRWLFKDE